MKAKFILPFLMGILLLSSCKDEKSADNSEAAKTEEAVVDNTFKVTLDVVVKKDDDFALFYTEDGSINFKDQPIWQGVKGSESNQEIKFSLPDGVLPTQLRLDLGLKKNQEDITLKSIILEHTGKKKVIAGAELSTFFRADDNKCTFEATTGLIKGIVKNGEKQAPSLYPQEANLGPELKKLY